MPHVMPQGKAKVHAIVFWGGGYKRLSAAQRLCASQDPQQMAILAPDISSQASPYMLQMGDAIAKTASGMDVCLTKETVHRLLTVGFPAIR